MLTFLFFVLWKVTWHNHLNVIWKVKSFVIQNLPWLTMSELLPQGILSRIQDVCVTCGFLGNTDNEVNGFSLTTFLFQGWSFPWQQFTLRLDSALFNSGTYNRCKHWKLYKSKLCKLAWEKWQHLDSKKWKKNSCFLRIFTVISNKEVKDRSTVCILSHLSFEMYDSQD